MLSCVFGVCVCIGGTGEERLVSCKKQIGPPLLCACPPFCGMEAGLVSSRSRAFFECVHLMNSSLLCALLTPVLPLPLLFSLRADG